MQRYFETSNRDSLVRCSLAFVFCCLILLFFTLLLLHPIENAYATDIESINADIALHEEEVTAISAQQALLELENENLSSVIATNEAEQASYLDTQSELRKAGDAAAVTLYKMEDNPMWVLEPLLTAQSLGDALFLLNSYERIRESCIEDITAIENTLSDLTACHEEFIARKANVESEIEDLKTKTAVIEQELTDLHEQLDVANAEAAASAAAIAASYNVEPGGRIAAAAIALAGFETNSNTAPGPASCYGATERTTKNARIAPPRTGFGGDWSTYLDVYAAISNGKNVPNHACCDCFPPLAVLWSGVDDDYLNGKYPVYESEFAYLSNSPKWDYVGDWYKKSGAGSVELQPGDILCWRAADKSRNHWMVYVGHEQAAKRWGEDTKVDCVDEGYRSRWANGKPLSSRGEAKWAVFRRNTVDYSSEPGKWSDVLPEERVRYL